MKKPISLILLICILLSCVSLCACNFVNPLNLEGYSEISEEDKPITKTVASRHDYSLTQYDKTLGDTFVDKIRKVQSSSYGFYKVSIDTNSCYYICGYGNTVLSQFMYMTFGDNAAIYEWYRVNSLENIQTTINNKELIHVFVVYDAVIERNILNGNEYNYKTKYYNKQNINKLEANTLSNDTYILYLKEYLLKERSLPYINSLDLNNGYNMYVDENGVEYLSFLHEYCSEDGSITKNYSKDLFLQYYDILSIHFVIIDELDEFAPNGVRKCAGIKIETLFELLFE